jgi:hypothetical protein
MLCLLNFKLTNGVKAAKRCAALEVAVASETAARRDAEEALKGANASLAKRSEAKDVSVQADEEAEELAEWLDEGGGAPSERVRRPVSPPRLNFPNS